MARKERPELPTEEYLYYKFDGRWIAEIAGSKPASSTMVGHLKKMLADFRKKQEREQRNLRPSQTTANGSTSQELPSTTELVEEPEETIVLTGLEETLAALANDPKLDKDARAMVASLSEPVTEASIVRDAILRATNTFHQNQHGHFIVPALWFRGCFKAAVQAFMDLWQEAAQKLDKRGLGVYPRQLDLGMTEADRTEERNVPLDNVRPGEAKASIKLFHIVRPRQKQFTLVLKVLNSTMLKDVVDNIRQIVTVMGTIGVGGSRPEFGTFAFGGISLISKEEGENMIASFGESDTDEDDEEETDAPENAA